MALTVTGIVSVPPVSLPWIVIWVTIVADVDLEIKLNELPMTVILFLRSVSLRNTGVVAPVVRTSPPFAITKSAASELWSTKVYPSLLSLPFLVVGVIGWTTPAFLKRIEGCGS